MNRRHFMHMALPSARLRRVAGAKAVVEKPAEAQYCSLKRSRRTPSNLNPHARSGRTRLLAPPDAIGRALPLDPSRVLPIAAGHHIFLQNLVEHSFMQGFPVPRGE